MEEIVGGQPISWTSIKKKEIKVKPWRLEERLLKPKEKDSLY